MSHIQEKAMLVGLSVSSWTASKKDDTVSKAVKAQHGGQNKSGWFNKRLIDPESLKPLGQIESMARSFHYSQTLPWGDNGDRLLPAKLYMDYTTKMREFSVLHETAVNAFVSSYPALVASARSMLGTMYNPADYPAASDLYTRFAIRLSFSPVPDAEDFRVDVGAEAIEEIKASINAGVVARQKGAIDECWKRLHTAVHAMVIKLVEPDAVFRDSLFMNVMDLVDLIPKLNITADKHLIEACYRVAKFAVLEPDLVRKDKTKRSDVMHRAAEFLDWMQPWVSHVTPT